MYIEQGNFPNVGLPASIWIVAELNGLCICVYNCCELMGIQLFVYGLLPSPTSKKTITNT